MVLCRMRRARLQSWQSSWMPAWAASPRSTASCRARSLRTFSSCSRAGFDTCLGELPADSTMSRMLLIRPLLPRSRWSSLRLNAGPHAATDLGYNSLHPSLRDRPHHSPSALVVISGVPRWLPSASCTAYSTFSIISWALHPEASSEATAMQLQLTQVRRYCRTRHLRSSACSAALRLSLTFGSGSKEQMGNLGMMGTATGEGSHFACGWAGDATLWLLCRVCG